MSNDYGIISIDADDPVPGSPTEGFGAASAKLHKPKSIKLPKLNSFDPNVYAKPAVYKQRDFWWGLVLEKLSDDLYEVSLQDNQIVQVYSEDLTGFEYQIYQLVLIGYDSANDRYGIITPPAQKYSRILRVTCTANVGETDFTFVVNNIQTLFAEITVPPDKTLTVNQVIPGGYSAGEIILVVENEQNGSWENMPGDRRVAVDSTDKAPGMLASKLDIAAGTYDPLQHSEAQYQITGGAEDRKIKVFVPKATGSGTIVVGCGLQTVDGITTFKNTDVAGFGLVSVTPGCVLKAYPEDFTGCHLMITYPEAGVTLINVDAASLGGSGLKTETNTAGACVAIPKLRVDVGESSSTTGLQLVNNAVSLVTTAIPTTALEYYGRVGTAYGFYVPSDRKVAASDADTIPSSLINKFANPGTYSASTHNLVYAQLFSDSTVGLFTAKPAAAEETSKTVLITSPVLGSTVTGNGIIIPRVVNGREYFKNSFGQWEVGGAFTFYHIHPDAATQSTFGTDQAYVAHVVKELGIWKLIGSSCIQIDYTAP